MTDTILSADTDAGLDCYSTQDKKRRRKKIHLFTEKGRKIEKSRDRKGKKEETYCET